jgi:tetratricopeptide (TPR) repeat protein
MTMMIWDDSSMESLSEYNRDIDLDLDLDMDESLLVLLDVAQTHVEQGTRLFQNDMLEDALVDFYEALEIRGSILGKYHVDVGNVYYWIGTILNQQRNFNKALISFCTSTKIAMAMMALGSDDGGGGKAETSLLKSKIALNRILRENKGLSDRQIRDYHLALSKSVEHERRGDEKPVGKTAKDCELALVEYLAAIQVEEGLVKCLHNSNDVAWLWRKIANVDTNSLKNETWLKAIHHGDFWYAEEDYSNAMLQYRKAALVVPHVSMQLDQTKQGWSGCDALSTKVVPLVDSCFKSQEWWYLLFESGSAKVSALTRNHIFRMGIAALLIFLGSYGAMTSGVVLLQAHAPGLEDLSGPLCPADSFQSAWNLWQNLMEAQNPSEAWNMTCFDPNSGKWKSMLVGRRIMEQVRAHFDGATKSFSNWNLAQISWEDMQYSFDSSGKWKSWKSMLVGRYLMEQARTHFDGANSLVQSMWNDRFCRPPPPTYHTVWSVQPAFFVALAILCIPIFWFFVVWKRGASSRRPFASARDTIALEMHVERNSRDRLDATLASIHRLLESGSKEQALAEYSKTIQLEQWFLRELQRDLAGVLTRSDGEDKE